MFVCCDIFFFISRRCLFKAARTSGLIFYLQSCSSRNELIWKSTLTSTKVIRDKRVPFKIQMQLLSWACGLPVERFVESLNNSVYPWGFWWDIWTNDSEFFTFVKHWSELACWRNHWITMHWCGVVLLVCLHRSKSDSNYWTTFYRASSVFISFNSCLKHDKTQGDMSHESSTVDIASPLQLQAAYWFCIHSWLTAKGNSVCYLLLLSEPELSLFLCYQMCTNSFIV